MKAAFEVALSARLILEDGREFNGYSFGAERSIAGEVVFNTGMVGYPESLTDPSYCGQILVITFPLIGNYGVAEDVADEFGLPKFFEGFRIHVQGLIVADYSPDASHYQCHKTLSTWLREEGVPAIGGIDTRAVTKHIRMHGAMLGRIVIGDTIPNSIPMTDPNMENLVVKVSRREVEYFRSSWGEPQKLRIIVVDCGVKINILRALLNQRVVPVELMVVPWDFPFGSIDPSTYHGVFLSNGPGDPTHCQATIENIRLVMKHKNVPIFGICLGNQLLALAAGATTYKMNFGNRGMNQPNHGFAVDGKSLPPGWKELFINANDRSNEGITHTSYPWLSVQFHPEACGGPTDTWFLFEQFLFQISEKNKSPPVTTIPISFPCQTRRVLILGSGGLSIGQAGEFDYSGTQAIKAVKEANLEVILINPNIATVQTSSNLADRVYFLPVLPTFVERVIRRDRPDGLLCSFGGQTALNCAVELHARGVLKKYNCSVLGTPIQAMIDTENRDIFNERLSEIGEACAPSFSAKWVRGLF